MFLKDNLKALSLGMVLFLALDALYLGSTSKMWNELLIRISGEKIQLRLPYAILCYLLILFSWYYFVWIPYSINKNKSNAIKTAAILGFCIYGIYEFTNAAIIKNWDFKFVVMDTLWGSILYSIVTYFTLSVLK